MATFKYYDETIAPQYGADHYRIENWTREQFAPDLYARVFFHINTPGFNCAAGHFDDETKRAPFYSAVADVLRRFSVPEHSGYYREDEKNGSGESLYIHPQTVSGVIAKCKIVAIADALDALSVCSVRYVSVHEDVSPITDAQFLDLLREKRESIAADLLRLFTTKRKNLYICGKYEVLSRVAKDYHVARFFCETYTSDKVAYRFVEEVFDDLLKSGRIVSADTKHGEGYRTAKTAA